MSVKRSGLSSAQRSSTENWLSPVASANDTNRRLAMLIDGDNASAAIIGEMLAETSKYGLVTIRRIYGDWTESNMKSWKETLQSHALQPIQQFRNTVGKNATDSAMIIDAMDILYTSGVDGFCLVSSDSDYTRLAIRIREKNLFVMGIGRLLTPRSFVNACDLFVYTENLAKSEAPPEIVTKPPTPTKATPAKPDEEAAEPPADVRVLFRMAYDLAVQEDGWAFLGAMGNKLRQLDPAFDPRTYGHRQLLSLIQAYPNMFEVRKSRPAKGGASAIYVRLKGRAAPPAKSGTSGD
ncbi:MAG: NYN domain-containing protein [Chloroflexi bacterium]|nr:NYN domain-containing protein [Chloroflexota bacterium]MBK9747093.1 NYN domain-containing protein [Chloroflexota bacterium]